MTPMHIDGSVYPDLESPPRSLDSLEARADYVHRICSAWDYGVQPDPETFALLSGWKDVFDRFPIVTSPAYHAVRLWFRWDAVRVPPGLHPPVPRYIEYDRIEGREADPCDQWI
jgi:hypothetical protein